MRASLARVGITTATATAYGQQFGLTLGTRASLEIEGMPAKLLTATDSALTETSSGSDLTTDQEALLWAQAEQLLEQLKQSPEETSMKWIPDLALTAGLLTGAVVATTAVSPVQAADRYVLGVCRIATQSRGAEISPKINGDTYLYDYHRAEAIRRKFTFDSGDTRVAIVKAPVHGELSLEKGPWSGDADYHYWPSDGYVGKDRFVMQVEKDGVKVQINYFIEAIEDNTPTWIGTEKGEQSLYCNPETWKISATSPSLDNTNLQTLLSADNLGNGVTVDIASLTGGGVGQTTGTTITLDTDAAGYGWYVDYTPYLNDEYLPTSKNTGSKIQGQF